MLAVEIITPDRIAFRGEASHILAPTENGYIGILPGHTPMMATLSEGTLQIVGNTTQEFPVEAGLLKVRANSVQILLGI
jgi:F-type H+-transporting ATPase subunit epsilon